ncbi:hypothetical protein Q3G72_034980 [Acer saccharum]|nr:hypothetical protein Q3G72_034980 [Acer saccharum]
MADVDPEVTTATAHHRKTRPRKSHSWDINCKPTIYAPLLPLPPDWTFLSDKKKAATFQLLARDSSDPYFDETPGNDRVFVRVDNSAYSFGNDNDDSNSIFADAPDDNPKFKLEHLPRDVKAYDASRVQVNEVKNDDAHERSIYSVASKSVGVKVQRAVDPEVAALLDDGDLSRFGSDVEDLEEDFIVQANCPEEGVDLDADEQFDLVEEDEVTHEVVDNEFPRARRPLDDQFDLLECQEYGTESDNEYDGYIAEEKETLVEKLKHVLKDKVADDLELDGGYKVPADILHATETPQIKELLDSAADVIRRCVEYGKIGALEIARKKRLAETVSGALSASNHHVITLRGKEKLPKRKQHGQESKEEKKERKAAVKEERHEARQAKKEMKGLYRCEAQNAQKVAAISGPSSIRLMI